MIRPAEMNTDVLAGFVKDLVQRSRISLSDEKSAQGDIEALLDAHEVPFTREYRLNGTDIADFLLKNGLAIEVKLRGSKMAVFRQIERYARYPRVTGVLLVSNLAMGLPEEVFGKPLFFASLGRGWVL